MPLFGRPSWQFRIPSGGGISNPAVVDRNLADMSLIKNQPGQNFTFALINASNDAPLTGATVTVKTSRDGGVQASGAGTVTELGGGVYNYAPTQGETNGNCCSFFMTATGAVPENLMFLTTGLHKGIAGQHVTFGMFTTSGAADASASITIEVSKDGGAQASGAGTVTNLGNGQYDYALTAGEANGINVSVLASAPGDVIQNFSIFTVP